MIYLPIAEMPVAVLLILLVSAAVGFVSGLVGVGGGFIMTPALLFLGVPAPVAVATGASQIAATSFSGIMTRTRRRSVDWRMGLLLSLGGVVGSSAGVALFERLLRLGQLDLIVSLLYLLLLSSVGFLMVRESYRFWRGRPPKSVSILRRPLKTVAHNLPFRLRFPRSGLYISVLPPLGIGFAIGAISAIMGIGGGFILIPAMIYLLRMPTNVVIGTSQFQVLVISSLIVVLQSIATHTVDLVLALLLMAGGVVGAQIGARVGAGIKAEYVRGILGALLMAASIKFAFDLVIPPEEFYVLGGGLF
ncbi:MAG: sulfite exporter TauE/SafE family protein [Terricaulis sp.]